MPDSIQLSRKFLMDTGGWKEMKEARSIHEAGRVRNASFRNNVIEADVMVGNKEIHVRLEFRSRTDVINHCPCYLSRRDGLICAHALAAGLEVMEPKTTPTLASPSGASTPASHSPAKRPTLNPAWPVLCTQAEEGAVFATLHFVLPPNFTSAWEKGRITAGIEISRGKERTLLKALPPATRIVLDPIDEILFQRMQELSPEAVPGILMLTPPDMSRLLDSLVAHPRITMGRDKSLYVADEILRLKLKWMGGTRFRAVWPSGLTPLLSDTGSWAFDGKTNLSMVASAFTSATELLGEGLSVSANELAKRLAEWESIFDTSALPIVTSTPRIRLQLEGSLNHLDADLVFLYGEREISAASNRPSVWEQDGQLWLADTETEQAAIADLEAAGFSARGDSGRYVNKDKDSILQFLAHGYPIFRQRWETMTGERFEHALGQVEPITPTLRFPRSGEDWFALEVGFVTPSGENFSRQEIQRLLESGRRSRPGAKGKIGVVAPSAAVELNEILSDCEPEQIQPGVYRIAQQQADYLCESVRDFGLRIDGTPPWQSRDDGTKIEIPSVSEALASILRPYQREGVDWMRGLASRGMGGILADDMGLGKTLQTLAFLDSIGGQSLVVCPSSVVHNWIAEAERFIPHRKAIAITGPNRQNLLKSHVNADLLVTSYALLRRDEAIWKSRKFETVILDEAQQIKNPEAQVSKVAHRLQAKYRFALTGTPIENSPEDLWSISRFALPGYLGSRDRFSERFTRALTGNTPDASARERLARRLRPVLLRRLKQEVARDLPDKIEQVIFCELPPRQREVYSRILSESRTSLLEAEGGRRRMLALVALLRLRQVCCDLRLLGLDHDPEEEASAKVETIMELLDEAIAGGHRVLVFSQFVSMLQILAAELATKRIAFTYLDGATKDRAAVVNRFQSGQFPVFLISLKAGGVGLNLTAADTVIHVDPWWNPAVEAQATDRAHRIGQERIVTSYKLIASDTVEEKILSLQNRKRSLVESLLADTSSTGISDDELMALFE